MVQKLRIKHPKLNLEWIWVLFPLGMTPWITINLYPSSSSPGFFLFVFSSRSRISKPSHWLRARTRVHSCLPHLLQTDKSWETLVSHSKFLPRTINFWGMPPAHVTECGSDGSLLLAWYFFVHFSHGRISRGNHGLLFPPWISAHSFLCTVLWIGESPVSFPFWLRLLHAAPGPKNTPSQEARPGKLGDLYLSNTWVILQCMFLKYLERFAQRILLLCYQKSYKVSCLKTTNWFANLQWNCSS